MINLFFADESGFSLTPCIPYGWQPIGKQLGIKSDKNRVCNLLGFLNPNGQLITYTTSKSINSDFVIHCIDEIVLRLKQPTVIVLDNAPWHKARRLLDKQEQWAQKNLFLFFLPRYSPHLNWIETLWRKIKYEWLRPEDYHNKQSLEQAIFNIIKKYDDEYCINFSKNFLLST